MREAAGSAHCCHGTCELTGASLLSSSLKSVLSIGVADA